MHEGLGAFPRIVERESMQAGQHVARSEYGEVRQKYCGKEWEPVASAWSLEDY
jgi:hypothetical protein